MIIRALDIDHDFTFGSGKSNYLVSEMAIQENIQTRVLSWLNNCFFDLGAGVDWTTYFSIKGIPPAQIELAVRRVILQSYGVVRVNSISASFDSSTRKINIIYNIDTIYTSSFTQNLHIGV